MTISPLTQQQHDNLWQEDVPGMVEWCELPESRVRSFVGRISRPPPDGYGVEPVRKAIAAAKAVRPEKTIPFVMGCLRNG